MRSLPDPASCTTKKPGDRFEASGKVSYAVLNSYAGGALGEYLGWLFQALWAIGITLLLLRSRVLACGPTRVARRGVLVRHAFGGQEKRVNESDVGKCSLDAHGHPFLVLRDRRLPGDRRLCAACALRSRAPPI